MRHVNGWRVMVAVGAAALACQAATAAGASPTLDELLRLKPGPAPTTQGDAAGMPLTPEVQRRLSGDEARGLLESAVRDMDQAAERLLSQEDAGLATQRLQRSVLEKLDQLIASAEQSGSGSSGGSSGGSGQREADAGVSGGMSGGAGAASGGAGSTGGSPPATSGSAGAEAQKALVEARAEWGRLPARVREELLQGMGDRVSPLYEQLTQEYYRRVAEEGRP